MPPRRHAPPPEPTSPTTFLSLVTHFTDFLTVAIHTILYNRNIYPASSFISARKFNLPVRQSRHPDVCAWINDAVDGLTTELLRGAVDRVALVIVSEADALPHERFVFDLSRFPVVANKQDWHVPLERAAAAAADAGVDPLPTVDLEEQFRGVMAKLAFCDASLLPLSADDDYTFTLAVELKDDADPPIGHPQPWIPVEPGSQRTVGRGRDKEVRKGRDIGGVRTTPLRSVEAGEMVFEMWIEEGKAKVDKAELEEGAIVDAWGGDDSSFDF